MRQTSLARQIRRPIRRRHSPWALVLLLAALAWALVAWGGMALAAWLA